MAATKPVRVSDQVEQPRPVEDPPAPEPVPPAPVEDKSRAAIQSALDANRTKQPGELTHAEQSKQFTAQVKARLAEGNVDKNGQPAPKRLITAARVQLRSAAYRIWDIITEESTPFEDVLDPAFWQHVSRSFATWDQLWVRCENGSYYAELIVTESGQLYTRVAVKVGPLELQVSEPDVDASIPSGYGVKWMGDHKLYGITRNGVCIKDGQRNKAACVVWIRNLITAGAR